jgi:hypothetical protein
MHRRERCLETLDGIARAYPSEVAGAHRRQEVKPEVGGRGAMRQHRSGVLLEIVRRQHAIFGGDESLEVPPRAPRHQPQLAFVGLR